MTKLSLTVLYYSISKKKTVDEKETEKRSRFSGNFELDNKMYEVENGIATITEKPTEADKEENKSFSLEELESVINKVIDAKLEPLTSKVDDIVVKNNEFSQGIEDVKLLTKQKNLPAKETIEVEENEEFSRIDNLKALSEWNESHKKRNIKKDK